jgi:anti-sigma B factor antagonist
MTELTISIADDGDRPLVVVRGELDAATAPQLDEALVTAAHGQTAQLVVDAEGITFCDSTGLRSLLLAPGRRPLVLRSPSERLRHLLKITDTAERFDII